MCLCSHKGQKNGPYALDYDLGLRPRPSTPGCPWGPECLCTPALVRGRLAPAACYKAILQKKAPVLLPLNDRAATGHGPRRIPPVLVVCPTSVSMATSAPTLPSDGSDSTPRLAVWKDGECLDMTLTLRPGVHIVGRSEDAAIVLEHPSCSRKHAAISVSADLQVSITDTDSAQGTFVDNAKMEKHKSHPLHDCAKVTFGTSTRSFVVLAPRARLRQPTSQLSVDEKCKAEADDRGRCFGTAARESQNQDRNRDYREDRRDSRDSRDMRGSRDHYRDSYGSSHGSRGDRGRDRDRRDYRDSRDGRYSRESRDSRESREHRDSDDRRHGPDNRSGDRSKSPEPTLRLFPKDTRPPPPPPPKTVPPPKRKSCGGSTSHSKKPKHSEDGDPAEEPEAGQIMDENSDVRSMHAHQQAHTGACVCACNRAWMHAMHAHARTRVHACVQKEIKAPGLKSIRLLKDKYGLKKDEVFHVIGESKSGLHWEVDTSNKTGMKGKTAIVKAMMGNHWGWADGSAQQSADLSDQNQPAGSSQSALPPEVGKHIVMLEKKYGMMTGEVHKVVGTTKSQDFWCFVFALL